MEVAPFEPRRHTECAYYVAGTLRVPSPRQKSQDVPLRARWLARLAGVKQVSWKVCLARRHLRMPHEVR